MLLDLIARGQRVSAIGLTDTWGGLPLGTREGRHSKPPCQAKARGPWEHTFYIRGALGRIGSGWREVEGGGRVTTAV